MNEHIYVAAVKTKSALKKGNEEKKKKQPIFVLPVKRIMRADSLPGYRCGRGTVFFPLKTWIFDTHENLYCQSKQVVSKNQSNHELRTNSYTTRPIWEGWGEGDISNARHLRISIIDDRLSSINWAI